MSLSSYHDRLEGFRKAMQEAHLPILDEYLILATFSWRMALGGYQLVDLPVPPTAIIASNNKLLLGVLQVLEERNIKIPQDLSILGIDDYLWIFISTPD